MGAPGATPRDGVGPTRCMPAPYFVAPEDVLAYYEVRGVKAGRKSCSALGKGGGGAR